MPQPQFNTRRWTVIGSGLLCGVLAAVVIFTNRRAFFSPSAVLVVAAIGTAAVLLQVRLYNRRQTPAVHPPIFLNVVGIVLALAVLFADRLHINPDLAQVMALAAVGSFAISSAIILHMFRKGRPLAK